MKLLGTTLGVILFLIASCSNLELCDENTVAPLKAGFYVEGTMPASDSVVTGLTVHVTSGEQPDSMLYDSVQVSSLELPLDPMNDQTSFSLTHEQTSDTLTVHYRRSVYLYSYECGFAHSFTLDSLVFRGELIQGAEIIRPEVDLEMIEDEKNIRLFL